MACNFHEPLASTTATLDNDFVVVGRLVAARVRQCGSALGNTQRLRVPDIAFTPRRRPVRPRLDNAMGSKRTYVA